MPHDDQWVEGKSEAAALHSVFTRKHKAVKKSINCFGGDSKLFADFLFSRRVLESNPHKKQGMTMYT
jgi:hypothetical protein